MSGEHSHQDGFSVPPDVPAYVEVPATYAASGLNVLGDDSDDRGGVMPILANELDNVVEPDMSEWLLASPDHDDPLTEAKFRTNANVSHFAFDDPIRNWGHPGTSHLHMFWGSSSVNGRSTRESLRKRAAERYLAGRSASTIVGGPHNATGYWAPMFLDGNGDAIPFFYSVVYYTMNPAARAAYIQRLALGTRYITGCNMDDPDDEIVKAEIAAANLAAGGPRYSYRNNGFLGYYMYTPDMGTIIQTSGGQNSHLWLKELNGDDPWAGAANDPGILKIDIAAPEAFDGTNLWSPGGYKHFRHLINDTETAGGSPYSGYTGLTWPNGWFLVPRLVLSLWIEHNGWASDVSNWTLVSDAHAETVAGRNLPLGFSMHNDWMEGWNKAVFSDASTGWQTQCTGAGVGGTTRGCNNSTINGTHRLIGFLGENAPDGTRMPQTTIELASRPARFTPPANLGLGPFTLG